MRILERCPHTFLNGRMDRVLLLESVPVCFQRLSANPEYWESIGIIGKSFAAREP